MNGFQKYLVGVQYIGTRFSGWPPMSKPMRTGSESKSIYYVLKDAIDSFIGKGNHYDLTASSRTDKGVHAFRNVFSVDLSRRHRQVGEAMSAHAPRDVIRGLNFYIGDTCPELRVVSATAVSDDFHARVDAMSRTYEYYIISRGSPDCSDSLLSPSSASMFHRDRAWVVDSYLDVDAMNTAAALLRGKHDFSSFRNSGCQSVSPIRYMFCVNCTVYPLTLAPGLTNPNQDAGADGAPPRVVKISLQANAFVYRMCRNIVSALLWVGQGEMKVGDFAEILDARDRRIAPPTAPAHGLFLKDVHYADNIKW